MEESGEQVTFLHKIVAGGADKSYGIHVARLAGLPSRVIDRAEQLLTSFEAKAGADLREPSVVEELPLPLFTIDDKHGELRRRLAEVDIDKMTPLEALIFLKDLKDGSQ